MSLTSITLDGGQALRLSKGLQSFSTSSLKTIPVLNTRRSYVQLGTHGSTVDWIAVYGPVIEPPGRPRRAYYFGRFKRLDGHNRAVFIDGTSLRLDVGVSPPATGVSVRAEIDPAKKAIVAIARTTAG